ncbi:hypothetical protein EPUL_005339 [Erysiphe pulchra]|uniref:CCHC-type domain-containing protein n=1 Tax=Erysiphe pulchra TaxID=225359 RepID=A0A2S4PVT8_9PEZI|nr:hypothetical protein EPUL_005339 [Erysiphe pulchra]
MYDSKDFITQGLKGLKPLSHSNYNEWRDIIDDYLDSQNWEGYIKDVIPANASEELRAKSAKIAVTIKTAVGSQRTYLLGLRTPKDILAKLEERNGGSIKGTISSLQRQFSSPDPNKSVDDIAIEGISAEDRPTELSKKAVLFRCYQEEYRTTVETLRIVASDFSFAQIVERLRQAEFESKETTMETALQVSNNNHNGAGKKETRKCYYCGKIGHIKPDCRKKKYNDKTKKRVGTKASNEEKARMAWKYEDYKSSVGTAKTGISLNVVGRGKMSCPINGVKTVFEGVLHIPELSTNLLSPGKLTNKVVAKGPKIGDTWVLKAYRTKEQALKADTAKQEEIIL